jgi:hypothetical protein
MSRLTLPAGEYYVVDPCYVLGDVYDEFIQDFMKLDYAKIYTYEKYKFLVTSGFGGDGTYDGHITGAKSRKIRVPVDAGMVALIPVALVKAIGGAARYPKVKFTKSASVTLKKVKKTSHPNYAGMLNAFKVSDGHNSVEVNFGIEETVPAKKNKSGRTRKYVSAN